MKSYGIVILLVLFTGLYSVTAQISTDCVGAIPICNNTPVNGGTIGFGIDDFNGSSTTGCLEQTITGAIESNSAWYRFRTGASGQLGFNIGFDPSEDWDFALYQTSDCNNLGEPVRCNFFDNMDSESFIGVGEDPTGNPNSVLYEDWLQVTPGEDYYLLINNFSNNNSGFSIQFSGQIFVTNPFDALDCSIISNLLGPPMAACDNENIVLDATTINALSYSWFMDTGSGFQSIVGEVIPTLAVTVSALYRTQVVTPTATIISDVQVAFSPSPTTFVIVDDASCSDSAFYDLSIKDIEALGAQNPNEYLVSYHNSLADAVNGVNNLPKQHPTSFGSETIYVRTTSVANPRCFDSSQQFQLIALQTPVVDFPLELYLCEDNTNITVGDLSPNPNYDYMWNTGETTSSITVSQAGTYTLTMVNDQAGLSCVNTQDIIVLSSQTPQITEIIIDDLQANNTVTVLTDIDGNFEYQLDDGNFQAGNVFTNVTPGMHNVTINDLNGCGEVTEPIIVVGFPKFFTPNGDGINDVWHIEGISNLDKPVVFIFDRYGKFLKEMTQNNIGWNGTFNGRDLPSADYWFKLQYEDTDGQQIFAKYVNNHFSLRR